MATYTQEVNGTVSIDATLEVIGGGTAHGELSDGVTDGSTGVRNDQSETSGTLILELADIPSDFGDLSGGGDKIEWKGYVTNAGTGNDNITLAATILDSGNNPISSAVNVATEASSGALTVTITGITEGSLANTNRLRLVWTYVKNQGPDNMQLELLDTELFWTYTVAVTGFDMTCSGRMMEGGLCNDLVEWFEQEEASGTAVGSKAGKVIEAVGSPGTTTGVKGNARTYNGSNQKHVDSTLDTDFNNQADMTAMAWVHDVKDNAGDTTITSKYHDTNNPGWALGVFVTDDKPRFQSHYGSGTVDVVDHSTAYTADATWEMVMGGRDSSVTANGDLWVEGAGDNAREWFGGCSGSPYNSANAEFAIGGTSHPTIQWFGKPVDNVAFWSRSLTESEEAIWLRNSGSSRDYWEVEGGVASITVGATVAGTHFNYVYIFD